MKLLLFFVILGAVTAQEAASQEVVAPPAAVLRNSLDDPVVAILRSVQHAADAEGVHSFDFEAENGIKFQFSGSEGENGGAVMQGVYSYPMEDGTLAEVTFVADENGYQPDSSLLPVAPAFPHPIPQYVLDQIEFARHEEERRAREGSNEQ